ncbi:MAG TPA: NAD-dependent epimerase/dehydratase family protein, partial [Oculatellaceae cyanobacterium]
MKILVSGATGFVGSALTYYLKRKGHQIIKLVRRASLEPDVREVLWNVEKQQLNPADLQDIDAVIHLAGENLAGRWTEERKQKILNSRVQGTQLIANTLAQMEKPPHVMLCASAVGYYGNRGDTRLTEVSGPGEGFLADVCRRWEAATQPAAEKGVRVVNTRFGLIMHPEGGVLKALYWPF